MHASVGDVDRCDGAAGRWLPEPVLVLLLGAVLAPVFSFGPLVRYMAWFLGALVHEMGHSTIGVLMGTPTFPAIRLDGHAAAVHQGQVVWLAWSITGLIVVTAVMLWRHGMKRAGVVVAVAAVAHPLIAFGEVRELLFLAGGHLGELAFATICFVRAMCGGFTASRAERVLYASLAWLLVADHTSLCLGLAGSAAARAEYAGNGSFGLTNDYIRIAEDVLGTSLANVGQLMLPWNFVPLPLAAWIVWRRWSRER